MKARIIKFCKVIVKYSSYQSIIEFCKIIRKRFGEKFRLWISYNWGIEFTSLFGSFKRVFTSGGKKLCSINEYGDKIVVEVRACKRFKARFQDIRRFDPVGEKKKNVLHPINKTCGVKPVILTRFTREKLD